jgi:hypothetical protein
MEYCINGAKCDKCGGSIIVINYGHEVSHGMCDTCFSNTVLPQVDFSEFVRKHCRPYAEVI